MTKKISKAPVYSIAEGSDALAVAQKIYNEIQTAFDVVLQGENLEWIIRSFIDLKTCFHNTKVLFLANNTSSQNLIDKLIKAGIDGIVFDENFDTKQTNTISKRITQSGHTKLTSTDLQLLSNLRGQIDALDDRLLGIANERHQLVKQISKIKDSYHLPVFQPERFREIEQSMKEFAIKNKADVQYLQTLIKAVHIASVLSQLKK